MDRPVDPAARLRALTGFSKALGDVHRFGDVIRIAAQQAQAALDAAVVSISVWERESGRLRVLVNHGDLAPGEERFPEDESYAVSDFPELIAARALTEEGRAVERPAWIQIAEDGVGDPKRVEMLRRRNRYSAMVAPIVFSGRVWGEIHAARRPDQPVYTEQDVEFGAALAAQIAAGLAQADHYEEVERLAYTDPLTGLANRRAIDAWLDRAMAAHRGEGTVVSLVVCDVNGLKRLNDERGHDVGDSYLVEFAGLLSATASELPGSHAARLGGDEFCILVVDHKADDAVRIAEELCRRALGMRLGEGIACGVASTGDPVGQVETAGRLFRLADAAQYRAKRSRSAQPVVAGRGQPPEPDLPAGTSNRDRRRYRGRDEVDPIRVLEVGFSALDAEKSRGEVGVVDRLEAVADAVARAVDAAAWWISRVEPGTRDLRTARYSVYRMSSEPSPVRDHIEGPDAVYDLELYPRTWNAVRGGALLVELEPDDLAQAKWRLPAGPEEARLAIGGYRAMVAAGAEGEGGAGWLVAVFTDDLSRSPRNFAPILRALVAGALTSG